MGAPPVPGGGVAAAHAHAGPAAAAGAHGAVPLAATHPRHIGTTAGAAHGGGHGFQERALGVLAARMEVIAANIANADTPGYKAVDLDFREALRSALANRSAGPAQLVTTNERHIPASPHAPAMQFPLRYHVPYQAAVDGNTVELDVERAKFAESAVRYEFALDRVRSHYMHMEDLLKNLK
ncbi:MAG: flagellar basal body rod protein FlgB [Pseudomonadota bacterium]|jgi:flagellar basal-body rod protein FlgB